MNLLPIFFKLEGRRVLVVGAGSVALEKTLVALGAGARVLAIAPAAAAGMERLARAGQIEWRRRAFLPDDLEGAALAIAATNAPEVNAAVFAEARSRGIPANSVDDPPNCDFYFGATLHRGALQVAVSTAGESPAVAQQLRSEIDARLSPDLGEWLAGVGRERRQILRRLPPSPDRKALLKSLADRPLLDSSHAAHSAADQAQPGVVHLVGAGPGDPDLLTVKAMRLLQSAQVILQDDLVPQAILDLAAPGAEIVNVGKRCGVKSITQEEIHALMIFHARQGRSVVRLKSGDPMLFGRAAEEIEALREAGIPFIVTPGVSAAFAAAAAAGCSLTRRGFASSLHISTAHRAEGRASFEHAPEPTRVIYMPGKDLAAIAESLAAEGLAADLPCVVVSRASHPDQSVHRLTVATLAKAGPVEAPSLILLGSAMDSTHCDGLEAMPQTTRLEPDGAALISR